MCCFSRPVRHVSGTRIFAREDGDRQILAYSMSYEIDEALAMVLPLPVPPDPGDDAVQFVDLSGYTSFLTDMEKAFPPFLLPAKSRSPLTRGGSRARTLPVYDVGAFHASFVPSPADFARLDERFRLPTGVFAGIPRYADYGFAVFQLKPRGWWRAKRQTAQPMAFRFPRRDPRSLFFPTVHVHDGHLPQTAGFDHALFCQPSELIAATFGWEPSAEPIGASVDASRAEGLVEPDRPAWRQVLLGEHRNEDVALTAPACAGLDALAVEGRSFRLRLAAAYAYPLPRMRGQPALADQERWQDTARYRLDALSAGLRVPTHPQDFSSHGRINGGGEPVEKPLAEAWFPGRACLLGEHCDWGGGSSLAIPLPMGIRVEAYACERTLQARSRVGNEVWEGEWDGPEVDRAGGRLRFVPACAWALRERNLELPPLRLEISADLPLGRGLSSSAALCLGLLAAMAEAAGEKIEGEDLAELAFHVENELLGIGCGRLDQIACAARAPVYLRWREGRAERETLRVETALHLVLGAFPGARDAAGILAALQGGHPAVWAVLQWFDGEARDGVRAIREGNPALLGRRMDEAQGWYESVLAVALPALRAPKLRAACAGLRERGALGAKFSGAGGDRSVIALFGDEAAAQAGVRWLEQQGLAAWHVPIGPG